MAVIPMDGRLDQELAKLWTMVVALSDQLRTNRDVTAHLLTKSKQVKVRRGVSGSANFRQARI